MSKQSKLPQGWSYRGAETPAPLKEVFPPAKPPKYEGGTGQKLEEWQRQNGPELPRPSNTGQKGLTKR